MYFWENDPQRALEWAKMLKNQSQNSKQKIETPSVLGAVICLGNCLDFTEQKSLQKIKEHYETERTHEMERTPFSNLPRSHQSPQFQSLWELHTRQLWRHHQ